jgi:hypothetical protein
MTLEERLALAREIAARTTPRLWWTTRARKRGKRSFRKPSGAPKPSKQEHAPSALLYNCGPRLRGVAKMDTNMEEPIAETMKLLGDPHGCGWVNCTKQFNGDSPPLRT